jgi:leader peptidase (prepilin peptidase) / N-methyltransferase
LTGRTLRAAIFLAVAICSSVISIIAAPGPEGAFGALLAVIMLAIARIDARAFVIPDKLTIAAYALALLRTGFSGADAGIGAVGMSVARSAVAAAALVALMTAYHALRGRRGLGFGDVKLVAVAGAWLDWMTIAGVIELAAVSALTAYACRSYARGRPLRAAGVLPFGLFLAPSIWAGWLAEVLLI